MAGLVVVPTHIHNQITAKVDAILAQHPELEPDKDDIRANIVHYFMEGYSLDAIQIEPTPPTKEQIDNE